ncbi:thiamine-phosphate diphosphorylase [Elizabethkingia meningoseptica]|uniref:thiamine phosphate synthase n=1 Tax=Elizabethkingia meningoseptica TaxID=238 RepID=UPI000999E22F|nr:thiamine phosphate synthase [Elizabethkingia meningoseptica]OPB96671.1 thiamine-phosphate diphosphorylase [Elizabethkingia meningoseptica]
MLSRLQYISQGVTAEEQEKNILNALQNGAEWIQLRWKNVSTEEFQDLGIKVKNYCRDFGAKCIINDHISVAGMIDADGVHLGLTDAPVAEARKILGSGKIIGGTANTIRDIQQRLAENCDYIGLGPFRFTSTKEKLSPVLGLKGYQDIFRYFQEKEIKLPPVFAIGGIQLEDMEALKNTGVYGVAVSGLIVKKPESISTIKTILQ